MHMDVFSFLRIKYIKQSETCDVWYHNSTSTQQIFVCLRPSGTTTTAHFLALRCCSVMLGGLMCGHHLVGGLINQAFCEDIYRHLAYY